MKQSKTFCVVAETVEGLKHLDEIAAWEDVPYFLLTGRFVYDR